MIVYEHLCANSLREAQSERREEDGSGAAGPMRLGSLFTLLTLISVTGARTAGRMCSAFSTVGTVVQLGSTFGVYCVFHQNKDKCANSKMLMFLDKKEIKDIKKRNGTTLFFEIKNIDANRTFACKCVGVCCLEPCGLDLIAGYPPDVPENLTCVQEGVHGNTTCTWKTGRDPFIETPSYLLLKSSTRRETIRFRPDRSFGGTASVSLGLLHPEPRYTVWLTVSNRLGNVSSTQLHFTLADIVKPTAPDITQVECSSSFCVVYWEEKQTSQLLQIQYRTVHGNWIILSISGNDCEHLNITNLEPFTEYDFQTRCKLSTERGVWSDWSQVVTRNTEEEAPLKEPDIWYFEESLHPQKSYRLLWKASMTELPRSEARGVVLGYHLTVEDIQNKRSTENIGCRNSSWQISCSHCTVTLSAFNSKGHSPAAHITLPPQTGKPPPRSVVCRPHGNMSLAISWQKPATAMLVRSYIVEWFTVKEKKDHNWRRIVPEELQTTITDINPRGCYNVAVYALYAEGLGKEDFLNLCSLLSARGPNITVKTWDNASVTVYWTEVPEEQRGGCLSSYKVFLKSSGNQKEYGKEYTTEALPPGHYEVWMMGWMNAVEGARGNSCYFVMNPQGNKNQDVLVIAVVLLSVIFFLVCLCCISPGWQRLSVCFWMIPDAIPDPANSKWAKETAVIKGQLLLDSELNFCCTPTTEEPPTVVVQEEPETGEIPESTVSIGVITWGPYSSSSLSHSPLKERTLSAYRPPHPKECGRASENSSKQTESSGTFRTIDYITSNGLQDISSEEGEDEENCLADFFPCPQSPFVKPLGLGGGLLTLDDVKINCKVFKHDADLNMFELMDNP
ncbi:interleukin-12 receptor subunit beta-2-like [Arapaima gigas]